MKNRTYSYWIGSLFSLYFLAPTDLKAQIRSDGTLSTQVITTTNQKFTIINGNRVGSNLFHSFKEFSVPKGGAAFFANDPDVNNIISRVTGTSISNIDGLLKTNGSANLFLINPNGIIFGQNASLNINGSFVTSTASSLIFADGTQFSATNLETPPLLTVSVPIGLQFGQIAQPIQIEGSTLTLGPGNSTLALLGGDILIKGGVLGAAGRIELGGVAPNSLVSLNLISEGWAFGYEEVQNFQNIQVSQGAVIGTSGEGNGAIQLRGKKIAIDEDSQLTQRTQGGNTSQPLTIKASDSVEVLNYSNLGTSTDAAGSGSDIAIATRRLIVRDGGAITAFTNGSGQGGNLTVDASESVEVLGDGIFTFLATQSNGINQNSANVARVNISTKNLILRDGGRISTSTNNTGNGGTLRVDASESVEASGQTRSGMKPSGLFAETTGLGLTAASGNAGDLIVNTQRLLVQNGAELSVSSTGLGRAGNLKITSGVLLLDNQGKLTADTTGGEGNINLRSLNLILRRGSAITTNATGNNITGGNININAKNGFIVAGKSENSDISANSADFRGGNVSINASGIFGTQFRNAPTLESDITATGANPSLSGNVQIITPLLDPTRGLVELSSDVDQSPLIAQACPASRGDVFIITGRGGLPPLPSEALRSNQTATVNWVTQGERSGKRGEWGRITKVSGSKLPNQIVPATGWVINDKGEVTLIAAANTTPQSLTPTTCPALY